MELKRLKGEIMEKAGEVMEYGHPTRFSVKTPRGRIDVIMRVGENEVYVWHDDDPQGKRGRWHEDEHLRQLIEDWLPVMRCEREDECDPCLWDEAFPDLAAAAAMFWRP